MTEQRSDAEHPPAADAPQGPAAPDDAGAVVDVVTRAGPVSVGPLRGEEVQALYDIFERIVNLGEGFPQAAPLTRADFDAAWGTAATAVIAARCEGELAGAYYLKPNFVGRASHIANAGYVVGAVHRGRGVGRVLIEDSIRRAPALGFTAIQFNLVFASNPARALYEELGWREIGRIPDAVDGEEAVIYWRPVG
jgi:GNAT superfamily N-acetyltransferase